MPLGSVITSYFDAEAKTFKQFTLVVDIRTVVIARDICYAALSVLN